MIGYVQTNKYYLMISKYNGCKKKKKKKLLKNEQIAWINAVKSKVLVRIMEEISWLTDIFKKFPISGSSYTRNFFILGKTT